MLMYADNKSDLMKNIYRNIQMYGMDSPLWSKIKPTDRVQLIHISHIDCHDRRQNITVNRQSDITSDSTQSQRIIKKYGLGIEY